LQLSNAFYDLSGLKPSIRKNQAIQERQFGGKTLTQTLSILKTTIKVFTFVMFPEFRINSMFFYCRATAAVLTGAA
jgi:hypothetical protein